MRRSLSVSILCAALFIGAPVYPGGWLEAEKAPDPDRMAYGRLPAIVENSPASPRLLTDGLWTSADVPRLRRQAGASPGADARVFELNSSNLDEILRGAPLEGTLRSTGPEISLPMPDGTFSRFRVEESPIVASESEGRLSRIRTYRLQGIDEPTATGRLSWTGSRLHALILSERAAFFVEPLSRTDDLLYVSSHARDGGGASLRCGVAAESLGGDAPGATPKSEASVSTNFSFGDSLHVYRLAVAATVEYTARVAGNIVDPTAAEDLAYAEIVATVNAANAVWERDLAIRAVLLAETDERKIIYANPDTDPYTSGDRDKMVEENQQNLDNVILPGNYDFGIVFDDCSGGLSAGAVCATASKGKLAAGGVCETEGFKFQTQYLVHEGGHQFTAQHTINYLDPGQYHADSAYEIGSGSTVMSYAGCAPSICGNESLQTFPDPYFHSSSIAVIEDFVTNGGGTCYSALPTGNQPPVVSAGPDYTIPKRTPFTLTATASDADGDPLQFVWEEYDLGALNPPNDDSDGQERPILRSFPPSDDPSRTFPKLGYILDDANDPPEFYQGVDKDGNPQTFLIGQSLPFIGRTMTFKTTARDGRSGVASDDMLLHVDGTAGPSPSRLRTRRSCGRRVRHRS